jgi:hypothetical protein
MKRVVVCAVLALAILPFLADAAPKKKPKKRKIAGTWNLRGWNMGVDHAGKESYTGKVVVQAKGKNTFAVTWKVGKNANKGVGIYDPQSDTFAAGYSIGGSAGCAIWNFSKDGKTMGCTGTFEKRLGQVAHEEWTR